MALDECRDHGAFSVSRLGTTQSHEITLSELLGLQWADVEHEHQKPVRIALAASKTKTARPRVLPLTKRAAEIVNARPRKDPEGEDLGPDAHVFGNELGEPVLSIKTAFEGACQRAGIEDLHFHDLRREFGLRLHEGGVPLSSIQRFLGHTDITTTSRYLRVEDRGLDGVLSVLDPPA